MKKIRIILPLVLAVTLLCISCKSEKKKYQTPEGTTEIFVNAFCTADFATMYDCTAANNRIIIQQIEKQMNKHKDKLKEIQDNKVEINNIECKMQNDSVAECVCSYTLNKNPRKDLYMLKKIDGKWLVDMRVN